MADGRPAERLDVLIDRACRGALTPGESRALRAAVAELRGQLAVAGHELTNQRELFDIAWEQQAADLERARRVAVALENENARLEAELDATFLHKKNQELHERAERAEQQLAQADGRADLAARILRAYPDDYAAQTIAEHIRGEVAWPDDDRSVR